MSFDNHDPFMYLIAARLYLLTDGANCHSVHCHAGTREAGAFVECIDGCPVDNKGKALWLIDQAMRKFRMEREAR